MYFKCAIVCLDVGVCVYLKMYEMGVYSETNSMGGLINRGGGGGDNLKSSVNEKVELPVAVTRGPILSYCEPLSALIVLLGNVAKLDIIELDGGNALETLHFSIMAGACTGISSRSG